MSNGHETKTRRRLRPHLLRRAAPDRGGAKPNDGDQNPPQNELRRAAGVGGAVGGAIGGVIGALIGAARLQHLH